MDTYVRSQEVVTRVVATETVLVPVRHKRADLASVYVLNDVGTWIWNHLDGSRTVDEIVAQLTKEFDVSPDVAAKDVTSLLADLTAERLVVPPGGEPSPP